MSNRSCDFDWQSSQTLIIDFSPKLFSHFSAETRRRCKVEARFAQKREKVLVSAKIIANRFWGWVLAYGSWEFEIKVTVSFEALRNVESELRFRLTLVANSNYWLFAETFFAFFNGNAPPMQSRSEIRAKTRKSVSQRENNCKQILGLGFGVWLLKIWNKSNGFDWGSSKCQIGVAISIDSRRKV